MAPTKVLVVEDEGLISDEIADRITKEGYHVAGIAASAPEAFRIIDEIAPDLVLMNIRVKSDLGYADTADRIPPGCNVPVIILTAHGGRETKRQARAAEPLDHLVQPFRRIDLASSIKAALYKHRSEQQLQERDVWLSNVIRYSPTPTVVTDRLGIIRYVNLLAEELVVSTRQELLGRPFAEAFCLFDIFTGQQIGDLVAAALRKQFDFSLPRGMALKRSGLPDLQVEGEISPCAGDGLNPGAVITLRDASHRSQEEWEVANEQKMLAIGRMAGGIVQSLNGSKEDIASLAKHLTALSCKATAAREVVSANEAVDRMACLLRSKIHPGIVIATRLNPHAGFVNLVPSQLDQVLETLVLRAAANMPAGGEIVLTTSAVTRESETLLGCHTVTQLVRIAVSDSGPGLEPDARNHLFEPFFETTMGEADRGLGLALVYSIVKEAEGELNVYGEKGNGSSFEILLPSAMDHLSAASANRPVSAACNLGTILLIEEESMLRAITHSYFERRGYNLLEAASEVEALEIARLFEGRIDAVVADTQLPGMDDNTLSILAKRCRDAKMILVSPDYPPQSAGPFLQKPFSLASLQQKIEEVLREMGPAVHNATQDR